MNLVMIKRMMPSLPNALLIGLSSPLKAKSKIKASHKKKPIAIPLA